MMKQIREIADALKYGAKGVEITWKLSEGQLEALALIPAELLKASLKSPGAVAAGTLASTIVNFVFAEMAFGVIEPDLDRVLALADSELANVNRISGQIRKDVDHLISTKLQLRAVIDQRAKSLR
jgi:hypothetical protein